jgi:hypothetical protein
LNIGLVFLGLAALSPAQERVNFRVVDGQDGRPIKNQVIDLWFGDRAAGHPLQATTSQDGTAATALPSDAKTFVLAGEGAADCRGGNAPGTSFIDANIYSVNTVLHSGIVAENHCGRATDSAVPGTFVLFLRPMHWWEKMRE